MKAIILAAGYATRLYPLTLNTPKALLQIKGSPIINYIIEKLERVDEIDSILVVTNERFYGNFLSWLEDAKKHCRKRIKILNDLTTSNENRLGSIGDLWFTIEKEKINDDIIVLNADNYFDFSLNDMVKFFNKKRAVITATRELCNEECRHHGIVELDGDRIISFEEKPEKPKTNLASIGIYIFPKNMLSEIGAYLHFGKSKDASGFLIKHFSEKHEAYSFTFKGEFMDIGNHESYSKAKCKQQKNKN